MRLVRFLTCVGKEVARRTKLGSTKMGQQGTIISLQNDLSLQNDWAWQNSAVPSRGIKHYTVPCGTE